MCRVRHGASEQGAGRQGSAGPVMQEEVCRPGVHGEEAGDQDEGESVPDSVGRLHGAGVLPPVLAAPEGR
ncbi:hypothetical protein [Streptomyces blattellae]|uniref:hypothetical protein n=1 Tax=Streptomyces blattellae TaxID=2569855 RepID=UPI0012B9758C|nr:hypothetical protein [Streptomyces blattellae]